MDGVTCPNHAGVEPSSNEDAPVTRETMSHSDQTEAETVETFAQYTDDDSIQTSFEISGEGPSFKAGLQAEGAGVEDSGENIDTISKTVTTLGAIAGTAYVATKYKPVVEKYVEG